jgi:hypothetical protein
MPGCARCNKPECRYPRGTVSSGALLVPRLASITLIAYAFRAAFGVNVVEVLLHSVLVALEPSSSIQHGSGATATKVSSGIPNSMVVTRTLERNTSAACLAL